MARDGDRLQMRVDLLEHTVEWLLTYPTTISIRKLNIPEKMRNQSLYPTLRLYSRYTGAVTLL